MKNPSNLLTGTVILAAGLGMGWFLRSELEKPLGNKIVGLQQAGQGSAGGDFTEGGRPGQDGIIPEGSTLGHSKTAGHQALLLLREMLKDGDFNGGPPPEFFNFLQAISSCDSATLKEMLKELDAFAKDPTNQGNSHGSGEFSMMILARLGNVDPAEAIDQLLEMQQSDGRISHEILPFIFASIAKNHPDQGQSFIDRIPDAAFKETAQLAWLEAISKQDPNRALEEYLAMPKPSADSENSQMHTQTERQLVLAVAHRSPERGIEAALAMEDGNRQSIINEIAEQWARRDPQELVTWALKSKDATGLRIAMEKNLAGVDTQRVRGEFASILPEGRPKELLAATLARRFAELDMKGATQWCESLSGANQLNARSGVAEVWIDTDPIAASQWLDSWPAGQLKDEAVTRLVNKIQADDPESAFTWALSIQGSNRYPSMAQALQAIQVRDPIAAANILEKLSEKERLLLQQSTSGR